MSRVKAFCLMSGICALLIVGVGKLLAREAVCPSACRPPEKITCTADQDSGCTGTPKTCTCVDAETGK